MLPNLKPDKSDSMRPPPLPARKTPDAGAFDRVMATMTIQRMRVIDRVRRLWARVKRRPVLSGVVAAAVALAGAAAVAVATDSMPDIDLPDVDIGLFQPATVHDARANALANPRDASAQRDYGHALWESRKRHAAVTKYARALALDGGAADDRMIANLVASFGGTDQRKAEALIRRNKLTGAESGLEALVSSKRYRVRWGAVHTLDKIEKGSRANWEKAYILDLDEASCDVRRAAVERLGAIGSRRSLSALRSAKADDEKTGGWFSGRCLGDRLEEAERKILARR